MEENGPEDLGKIVNEPKRICWDSESRQDPHKQHNREYLLEEGQAKHFVPLGHDVKQLKEPDKRNGNEEVDERFSEQSHKKFLRSFHFLILLLGEQNGLRDISPIQISIMLVMMIVSVSPGVEGEVLVDAEDFPDDGVHRHGLEEGEMSHVVELDEEPNGQEDLTEPSNDAQTHLDEQDDDGLFCKRYGERHPGLFVIGLCVLLNMLLDKGVLRGLYSLICL